MTMQLSSIEWRKAAKKANQSIDEFMRAMEVRDEMERELQSQRRASDEDRQKIAEYLEGLNGHISVDMPVGEILAGAGVFKKQGTSMFAKRHLKRLVDMRTTKV